MSSLKIIEDKFGKYVVVNGRKRWLPMIESVERSPKSSYEFLVKHRNLTDKFVVWGGKASGGRSNEWYVDWPNGRNAKCSSLMDAMDMINGM